MKNPKSLCKHGEQSMGYFEWYLRKLWAKEQLKKGIEQPRCLGCKIYLLPEEAGEK